MTYISETDVRVSKVKRYHGVINITQSIENHKTTVTRETNTIRKY